jgi:hypothetical protein
VAAPALAANASAAISAIQIGVGTTRSKRSITLGADADGGLGAVCDAL